MAISLWIRSKVYAVRLVCGVDDILEFMPDVEEKENG